MQMITSENGQPMLTDMPKHFIRMPVQIDKHYHQHFLISNKLPKEVVKNALNGMLDASKKYQKKWKELDSKPPYLEEYLRLKKDGTWKKIKDLKVFREKMKATHRKYKP